jgi:hypothetical protein
MKYDHLLESVLDMGSSLMSWNLKYDRFPNIKKWLSQNWTAPYGSEVAERYLDACIEERSANYWGQAYQNGREKNDSFKALKSVIADLKGDDLSKMTPTHLASALRRIATALDNSTNPSRALVVQDIERLLVRLAGPTSTVLAKTKIPMSNNELLKHMNDIILDCENLMAEEKKYPDKESVKSVRRSILQDIVNAAGGGGKGEHEFRNTRLRQFDQWTDYNFQVLLSKLKAAGCFEGNEDLL